MAVSRQLPRSGPHSPVQKFCVFREFLGGCEAHLTAASELAISWLATGPLTSRRARLPTCSLPLWSPRCQPLRRGLNTNMCVCISLFRHWCSG